MTPYGPIKHTKTVRFLKSNNSVSVIVKSKLIAKIAKISGINRSDRRLSEQQNARMPAEFFEQNHSPKLTKFFCFLNDVFRFFQDLQPDLYLLRIGSWNFLNQHLSLNLIDLSVALPVNEF